MCTVLSNLWKTLNIVSDGDNKLLNREKNSQPLFLNGRVPNERIDTDSWMKNPDLRRPVDNAVLSRSSMKNVYNNALQDAAAISLEARQQVIEPMKKGDLNMSASLMATTKTAANIGAEVKNADELNPESLPQFSPQGSQNEEGNHQNGKSIENGDSSVLKEDTNNQPPLVDNGQKDIKSNDTPVEDQIPVKEPEDEQSENLNPESVKQNVKEDVGKNDIEGDNGNGNSDHFDENVKTIEDDQDDKKTTKKVTPEEKFVEPDNVDDDIKPNDEISNQHSKPIISKQPYDDHMDSSTEDPESSNFISYFFVLTIITICGYLIFYNKKKLIALCLEGRRGRSTGRRSRSGSRSGRSSSAQYRKLDNNLEEAMGPNSSSSYREVIY